MGSGWVSFHTLPGGVCHRRGRTSESPARTVYKEPVVKGQRRRRWRVKDLLQTQEPQHGDVHLQEQLALGNNLPEARDPLPLAMRHGGAD